MTTDTRCTDPKSFLLGAAQHIAHLDWIYSATSTRWLQFTVHCLQVKLEETGGLPTPQIRESIPGHIGVRQALSPLHRSCSHILHTLQLLYMSYITECTWISDSCSIK